MPLLCCRGSHQPLRAVFRPLQVVSSFACSVASLSRFPDHHQPGHLRLPSDALADHLFGLGYPSTQVMGRTAVHNTPTAKPPFGRQRAMTLPSARTLPRKHLYKQNRDVNHENTFGLRFRRFGRTGGRARVRAHTHTHTRARAGAEHNKRMVPVDFWKLLADN